MLEQQAHFAADIQIGKEIQAKEQARLEKVEARLEELEQSLAKMVNILEKITNLQEQAVANISALPPIIAETDERVNTLITIFERFLSEGLRNLMDKVEVEENGNEKEPGTGA